MYDSMSIEYFFSCPEYFIYLNTSDCETLDFGLDLTCDFGFFLLRFLITFTKSAKSCDFNDNTPSSSSVDSMFLIGWFWFDIFVLVIVLLLIKIDSSGEQSILNWICD